MRAAVAVVAILSLGVASASAQAPAATSDERAWSLSASVSTYLLPDQGNYAQPTLALDVNWFHSEARYNYEALRTGSVWVGINAGGGGEKLTWEFTPMLGGVFGDVTAVAPGYKGSLSWWKLDLYSEGEVVIDTAEASDSFFYNWSEASLLPASWFRIGMVTQRTRAYQTTRDIQRGLLIGLSYKNIEATTYVFNPDESAPTVVVSVAWALSQ